MLNYKAPLHVFHRTSLIPICLVAVGLVLLWMLILGSAGLIFIFAIVFLIALGLLVEVRMVSFYDKYLLIDYYLLRKRRIDYSNIDYVSFETRTHRSHTYNFVCLELANDKKIRLGGFKEGNQLLYEQLKSRESTNEEFLKAKRT